MTHWSRKWSTFSQQLKLHANLRDVIYDITLNNQPVHFPGSTETLRKAQKQSSVCEKPGRRPSRELQPVLLWSETHVTFIQLNQNRPESTKSRRASGFCCSTGWFKGPKQNQSDWTRTHHFDPTEPDRLLSNRFKRKMKVQNKKDNKKFIFKKGK